MNLICCHSGFATYNIIRDFFRKKHIKRKIARVWLAQTLFGAIDA